jgi:hypothetical protein
MQLTLEITNHEGTYSVSTNLFTIVLWERRFKRKAADMANGIGVEDLLFLAWEASKQAKIVVPADFDKYCQQVTNIEITRTGLSNNTIVRIINKIF